jgi:hypothetical protein
MPRQLSLPTGKVSLSLTNAERKLILKDIYIFDTHLLRPIFDAPRNQAVEIPLDDLDDLACCIERESQRDFHEKVRPQLQRLHQKLRKLIETDAAADGPDPTEESNQTFPVVFSSAQRRVIAECVPDLASRLNLEQRNNRAVQFTLAELRQIKKRAKRAVLTRNIWRLYLISITNGTTSCLYGADRLIRKSSKRTRRTRRRNTCGGVCRTGGSGERNKRGLRTITDVRGKIEVLRPQPENARIRRNCRLPSACLKLSGIRPA